MWHYVDAWDWLWMTVMMAVWVVLIGFAVYIAVQLASGGKRS